MNMSMASRHSRLLVQRFPRQKRIYLLRSVRRFTGSKQQFSTDNDDDAERKQQPLYLHVGPSGDCWTGPSIFAAKHLQPDYVKSIALPCEFHEKNNDEERVEALLAAIEQDPDAQRKLYDEEKIPESILEKLLKGTR